MGHCLVLSAIISLHVLISENILVVLDSRRPRNTTATTIAKSYHLSVDIIIYLSVCRRYAVHFTCIFSHKASQQASEVLLVCPL